MSKQSRMDYIIWRLEKAEDPLSASLLAKELGVSRQIVVGDIAILRAEGQEILATSRGYLLPEDTENAVYKIACKHKSSQILEELYAVVDCGASLLDVSVEHPLYGELVANLQISNRIEAEEFVRQTEESKAAPLSQLTDELHLHRIRCEKIETLEKLKEKLRELGILFE